MTILIFGKSGQLAVEIGRYCRANGTSFRVYGRPECDVTRRGDVAAIIKSEKPRIVVNAAAYTAVDAAEHDEAQAYAVNRDGPLHIAQACAASGIPLIHVSTDYVFDGRADRPYRETDPAAPLNVYGASKLAGEQVIAETHTQHLIIRTSWVFSDVGKNFFNTLLGLYRGPNRKSRLEIVDDQIGGPTGARALAEAVMLMSKQAVNQDFSQWGVYHYQGAPATSWYGLAQAFFACWPKDDGIPIPELCPIATADYPSVARRPLYSVLDTSLIQRVFGLKQPDWHRDVRWYCQKL